MKPATQSMGKLPPNPREACHVDHGKVATQSRRSLPPSERSDAGRSRVILTVLLCQPRLPFPHGFALQGDLVRVMDQAVKDRVGQRGIPQGLMPVLDRELTGDNGGPATVAIFEEFQQVAAVLITERGQSPVIENEKSVLARVVISFP